MMNNLCSEKVAEGKQRKKRGPKNRVPLADPPWTECPIVFEKIPKEKDTGVWLALGSYFYVTFISQGYEWLFLTGQPA